MTEPLAASSVPVPTDQPPPWPGGVEERGGQRLYVRRTDPELSPGDAPTAVYVHGLGGTSTNWTELGVLLAPLARGVAVDLPGFGFTVPEDDFDFSMPAHADFVTRFIESLGTGPVHLVGNSMGGTIAILLAARRPDLVRTLTLVSPAVPDLRPSLNRLSDPRMALAYLPVVGHDARRQLLELTTQQRVHNVMKLCFADLDRLSQRRFDEMVAEHELRGDYPWLVSALTASALGIFRSWAAAGSRSLWRVLQEVAAPSLVVWGTEDRVVSARKAGKTLRMLRDAELLMLRDSGHVSQMEWPHTVATAVAGLWKRAGNTAPIG